MNIRLEDAIPAELNVVVIDKNLDLLKKENEEKKRLFEFQRIKNAEDAKLLNELKNEHIKKLLV